MNKKRIIISLGVCLLVVFGFFWWRSGFTLDVNRFFASATCPAEGQRFCSGGDLYELDANPTGYGCAQTKIEDCGTGTCVQTTSSDAQCQAAEPPPAEPPPAEPPPATNACSGKFILDDHDGVTVCYISSSISRDGLCTIGGRGSQHTWTVRIVNNQASGYVYSRVSLFYQPTQTCSANAEQPVGTAGIRSGDGKVYAGETEDVTYTFTFGEDCGAYQLDDTWGPGSMSSGWFAIGKVFNTGVSCATPTPTPSTTVTPTPTPSTTVTPTPTPSTTVTPTPTPSTTITPTPSTTITPTPTPSTTVTPIALVCAPKNQNTAAGQTVQVTVSGGTAPFTWWSPGSAYMQPEGSRVSVRYNSSGSYSIVVQDSAGRTDVCYVYVQQIATTIIPPTYTPLPTYTPPPPVTQVPTGPGETTALALIVASIVTLLYVSYTGTDAFRRGELKEHIDAARRDKDQFNFKK